jgi:hypothetical protein
MGEDKMSVTTSRCPTCGAPINGLMRNCGYCGSGLYYSQKPGTKTKTKTIARNGENVVVVRHDQTHIPERSSYGYREYVGKGGSYTQPNIGFGQVIFPTEEEMKELNDQVRARHRRAAQPLYNSLAWLVIIGTNLFMLLIILSWFL